MSIKALVLAGDGLNCQNETNLACTTAGFAAQTVHVNDLLADPSRYFSNLKLFVIPGGFSFGDELGSGKILALKLKHGLGDLLDKYLKDGGAMLGICNGFQALARLGIFNEAFGGEVVLAHNRDGHFLNRWVGMSITGKSIFTDKIEAARLELPIRHGEGRLVFADESKARLAFERGAGVLRYEEDINGAFECTAGISAFEGRVLGLMPHPEAFWCEELHPSGNMKRVPLGTKFFESAFLNLK